MNNFLRQIKQELSKKGISQNEYASLCGFSNPVMCRTLSGECDLTLQKLETLANALDLDVCLIPKNQDPTAIGNKPGILKYIENNIIHLDKSIRELTTAIKEKDTTGSIANCYNFCDHCPYYKQNSEGYCTYGKICQRIIAAYQEERERATSSVIDDEFRLEDDGK